LPFFYSQEVEPRCEERRDGRHVSVRLWVDTERSVAILDEEDVTHEWALSLGRRVPIDLSLGLAACEGDVDLGGAALRRAKVTLGAGKATLRFSSRNPCELEELRLEMGAGHFIVRELGNARCRSIAIEAGAGEFEIDCRGEWSGSSVLRIEAGMGGVEIRVPRDLAVRVDATDTIFGEVSAPDFRQEDEDVERFVSPNWDEDGPRLTIEVEASFAGVNVLRE
jgi:hypothetical protein